MQSKLTCFGRLFAGMLAFLAVLSQESVLYAELSAQTIQADSLTVSADELQLDSASRQLVATGNVRVLAGGISAQADTLAVDLNTGEILLSGSLTANSSDLDLRAESLSLWWREGRLLVLSGKITIRSNDESGSSSPKLVMRGAKLERLSDGSWRLESADITPCDCGEDISPSFRLACREATIRPGKDIELQGATVQIHDTPVFGFSHLTLPLAQRKSGLLTPRLGYSDRLGARYQQEFYWAISRQVDLTLGVDGMTRRGVAPTLESRAVAKQFTWYQNGFYLYDLQGDDAEVARHRFGLNIEQSYQPRKWARQVVSSSLLSDTQVRRDFGWNWTERERDYASTDAGLEFRGPEWAIDVQAMGVQRLFDSTEQDGWLWGVDGTSDWHLFPRINVSFPAVSAYGGRLLFEIDARLSHWVLSSAPAFVSGDPSVDRVLNVEFSPMLRAPLLRIPGATLELHAGLLHVTRVQEGSRQTTDPMGAADIGLHADLRLFRVYGQRSGGAVVHSLSPSLDYSWSPGSYGTLPMDGVAAPTDPTQPLVPAVHHLTVALDKRVAGITDGLRREWFGFKLWQRVLFDSASRERAAGWLDAGMAEMDVDAPYAHLRTAAGVDWASGELDNAASWLSLGPLVGLRLNTAWRYVRAGDALGLWWWQRRDAIEPLLHQLALAPSYSPLKWLTLRYRADLRLDDVALIEQSAAIRVSGVCNCWSAELAVVHRPPVRVPDFWLNIDLSSWMVDRGGN